MEIHCKTNMNDKYEKYFWYNKPISVYILISIINSKNPSTNI